MPLSGGGPSHHASGVDRCAVGAPDPLGCPMTQNPRSDPPRHLDRRALLAAAAAGVGLGVGVGLAGAEPAGADDTDPLVLGAANTSSTVTSLTTSAAGLSVTSTSNTAAFGVYARRASSTTDDPAITASTHGTGPALLATVTTSGTGTQVQHAVKAVHSGAGGGLLAEREGTGASGAAALRAVDHGTRGAIEAESGGVALRATGGAAALALTPTVPLVPTSGAHTVGEVRVDAGGEVVVCTQAGSPGRWRRVIKANESYDNGIAGTEGWAGAIHLMELPYRMFDSRPDRPPPQGGAGKLEPGVDEDVRITLLGAPGNGGHVVPGGAVGVLCTITVTETEGSGWVKAFPTGIAAPNTSVLNWWDDGQTLATTTIVRIGEEGDVTLRLGSNRAHVLLDIVGFVA